MHIFLQGASGTGKSGLLRGLFTPYSLYITGFTTQKLIENGEAVGFRLASFENGYPGPASQYAQGLSGVFLYKRKWYFDPAEEQITSIESEVRRSKLVVLDEIGGVELASVKFMESLRRILSGQTPCVGVFKSAENFERMSRNLGLGKEYTGMRQELEAWISSKGEIVSVNEGNISATRSFLWDVFRPFL